MYNVSLVNYFTLFSDVLGPPFNSFVVAFPWDVSVSSLSDPSQKTWGSSVQMECKAKITFHTPLIIVLTLPFYQLIDLYFIFNVMY